MWIFFNQITVLHYCQNQTNNSYFVQQKQHTAVVAAK